VRALLWPVTDWPVWVQTVTELADTTGVGAALTVCSEWVQSATVVVGTSGKGAALASRLL
jgi:hypothetical protein